MFLNDLYYTLKPFIPRRLQIEIRRQIVSLKRKKCSHVWPIDEKAAKPPEGWKGWPNGKKFALVLLHDVDTGKGQEKCYPLIQLDEEMGVRSSFNIVPERYHLFPKLRRIMVEKGFEVGVHGLKHDGKLFSSRKQFEKDAVRINQYLKDWRSVGFVSPSMHRNLDWIHDLNVEYDASTFDTDPFEPQPDGVGSIFPLWVPRNPSPSALDLDPLSFNLSPSSSNLQPPTISNNGFIELPYTLPQDHTLFIVMEEKNIDIWKKKLDWIVEHGGMALLITHPDYMNFDGKKLGIEEYPVRYYEEFITYIKDRYEGQYWNALPKEITTFWFENYKTKEEKLKSKEICELKSKNIITRVPQKQTIWIDLDNSPHVPFFSPIIEKLKSLGYEVQLTARDCSQTCALADLFNMNYKRIGKHYGKNKFIKVIGTVYRSLQLTLKLAGKKPEIAISHGSRAQMIAARLMRIPSLAIMDYEHVKGFISPTRILTPEVISKGLSRRRQKKNLTYPGIKEDVYAPNFVPDLSLKNKLGINGADILVTIRPPATEAHYHNPAGQDLFKESVSFLSKRENVCMILLPRNERQKDYLQTEWPDLIKRKKLIIPENVVEGLNLIWNSDLVISGGGTMNREAAALGVPVYSIFRGKPGAVDQYLSDKGRLILLKSIEDISTKISLKKRVIPDHFEYRSNTTLNSIIDNITTLLKN